MDGRMSNDLLHRNIRRILLNMKIDVLGGLCSIYEDCSRSPDDRTLEVAASRFLHTSTELDTLRRVLVEQQVFWFGAWYNEDPQKRHPEFYAEECQKHGQEALSSLRLPVEVEMTLREIETIHRLVSSLGHMIYGAKRIGGLVSKVSERRKHLSQSVCLGEVEELRAISNSRAHGARA